MSFELFTTASKPALLRPSRRAFRDCLRELQIRSRDTREFSRNQLTLYRAALAMLRGSDGSTFNDLLDIFQLARPHIAALCGFQHPCLTDPFQFPPSAEPELAQYQEALRAAEWKLTGGGSRTMDPSARLIQWPSQAATFGALHITLAESKDNAAAMITEKTTDAQGSQH